MFLKGTPCWDTSWPENTENVPIFLFEGFVWLLCSVDIFATEALNLSSSWHSHVGVLFTSEQQQ